MTANPVRPVLVRKNASQANVEKVVNPPRTPTVIGVVIEAGSRPRAHVKNSPRKNEPETLIRSVAQGKMDLPVVNPIAYRITEPTAPPTPTQTNLIYHFRYWSLGASAVSTAPGPAREVSSIRGDQSGSLPPWQPAKW
jgi:hypothetical protein